MEMRFPYELPPLPYAYDALAPIISDETLHFHHDKHFKTYIDNLNKALEDCDQCQDKPLEELLRCLDTLPEAKRTAIRNNGGGVYNHALYFVGMAPNGGGQPSGGLAQAMERAFGPYEAFKKLMKDNAVGQFGSGYAFLCCDGTGTVCIVKTANQDSPSPMGFTPSCAWTYGSTPTISTTRIADPTIPTSGLTLSTGPLCRSGMRAVKAKKVVNLL